MLHFVFCFIEFLLNDFLRSCQGGLQDSLQLVAFGPGGTQVLHSGLAKTFEVIAQVAHLLLAIVADLLAILCHIMCRPNFTK